MAHDNFQRMMRLAEEFFATKDDPAQISVTEEVMEKLRQIHPATMSEEANENGPIAWILLLPTTDLLMHRFLRREITERELLEATPPGAAYDCLYLCSALVLPEFRRKGLAKEVICRAIQSIRKDHTIRALFVWTFSEEGDALARTVAQAVDLPLYGRES